MTKDQYAPVTPGDMLKHEFLAEYGLSQNELAQAIGVSPQSYRRDRQQSAPDHR